MIMALSLLVIVHEFGHYFFARLFGIWVEKFYMFFNPIFSIVRWDPRQHKLQFFVKNPSEPTDEKKDQESSNHTSEQVQPSQQPPAGGKSSWRDTVYGIG